jgi:hypothetical protein
MEQIDIIYYPINCQTFRQPDKEMIDFLSQYGNVQGLSCFEKFSSDGSKPLLFVGYGNGANYAYIYAEEEVAPWIGISPFETDLENLIVKDQLYTKDVPKLFLFPEWIDLVNRAKLKDFSQVEVSTNTEQSKKLIDEFIKHLIF